MSLKMKIHSSCDIEDFVEYYIYEVHSYQKRLVTIPTD